MAETTLVEELEQAVATVEATADFMEPAAPKKCPMGCGEYHGLDDDDIPETTARLPPVPVTPCPVWADGQHCYVPSTKMEGPGNSGPDVWAKRCTCGAKVLPHKYQPSSQPTPAPATLPPAPAAAAATAAEGEPTRCCACGTRLGAVGLPVETGYEACSSVCADMWRAWNRPAAAADGISVSCLCPGGCPGCREWGPKFQAAIEQARAALANTPKEPR